MSQPQADHHAQIKQDGRRGGCGESIDGVEDAAVKCHQGHQQQIRKGDPRKADSQREPFVLALKARRQQADYIGRERQREAKQNQLACQQQGEDPIAEHPCGVDAVLLADARVSGDESRIERSLGENSPELIGNRKATKKASAIGPAPKTAAIRISRKNPVRRDNSVSPPTVRMRLIMLVEGLPALKCSLKALSGVGWREACLISLTTTTAPLSRPVATGPARSVAS